MLGLKNVSFNFMVSMENRYTVELIWKKKIFAAIAHNLNKVIWSYNVTCIISISYYVLYYICITYYIHTKCYTVYVYSIIHIYIFPIMNPE